MTVASEIQRLQGAKASARASIINKGVNVPASAKVDDYHTYIDMIQQGYGPVLTSGLKLFNNRVSNEAGTPAIREEISLKGSDGYYGCCVCDFDGQTANSYGVYLYTYRKVDSTNDMAYYLNTIAGGLSSSIYTRPLDVSLWLGGTGGSNIKVITFLGSTYSTSSIFCYETVWDYKTTGIATSRLVGRGDTTDINDYDIDLDNYSEITSTLKQWVGSVTGDRIDHDAYIYLTLK